MTAAKTRDVAMKRLLLVGTLLFVAISPGEAAMAKKIDKETLANKIKALAGLDAEERSELLGLLSEQKKYGLVWEDKPEDVEAAMREQLPVLAEVKERAIIAPNTPNHILIEGDNLHAYNEEFEDVADKVELCALPAAIRNAYRRVIGKYRPQEEDAK